MANRIQKSYNSHVQQSSPDMERLWARIEGEIDNRQAEQTRTQAITHKKNSKIRYIAAAASLVLVLAGAVIFANVMNKDIKTDNKAQESSFSGKSADSNGAKSADGYKTEDIAGDNKEAAADEKRTANKAVPETDNAMIRDKEKTQELTSARTEVKKLTVSKGYITADTNGRKDMLEALLKKLKASGDVEDYSFKYNSENAETLSCVITYQNGASETIEIG